MTSAGTFAGFEVLGLAFPSSPHGPHLTDGLDSCMLAPMGIEDQIAVRLRQGVAPRQLIAEGFKKSTVYKVLESLSAAANSPAPRSLLSVHMATDKERYLPGTTVQATFSVSNQTSGDLYIFQAGARPDWLGPQEWIATTVRKLLAAGASTSIRLSLAVPPETTLGERDVYFGIQGQWVGPHSSSPSNELMWTNPMILRVQRPPSGLRVFVAHSVFNASLVAQLESTLDDNGMAAALDDGLSGQTPTTDIDRADFLVAIITDPSRMGSVLEHVNYARSRKKELILLVDAGLRAMIPHELAALDWILINFGGDASSVLITLFQALERSIANRAAAREKEQSDAVGVILMALGALVAGVVLGRGKPAS